MMDLNQSWIFDRRYCVYSVKTLVFKVNIFFCRVTGEISGGFGRADSDEDDGPMIPDLDDVQDEDMALQVKLGLAC